MKRVNSRKKSSNKKRKIVVLSCIILVIVLVCIYNINRNKITNILSRTAKYVTVENGKMDVNFKKLKKINKDVIAYVKIEGTDIEFPVVKSEDNEYYTNHNLYKNKKSEGWAFVDYRCKVDGYDKNLVIYGNKKEDTSIFSTVVKKINSIMYKDSVMITLATENGVNKYQVFSIYQLKKDTYYNKVDFNSVNYSNFLNIVKKRSIKDFKVEVSDKDNVLTLASCKDGDNDYITIVHAKKV